LDASTAAAVQTAIDVAVSRAFIYQYLATAYADPNREAWDWLCASETQESLGRAWDLSCPDHRQVPKPTADGFEGFHGACLAAFGHAARGNCPMNEIEYGDIKADPLFQPHRLADVAAFYRAFGLEVATEAGERQDHLCLELEFMCVLAAKEAYALGDPLNASGSEVCCDAEKQFLREHLGRWTPAFARRLATTTPEPVLRALADFTLAFIECECAHFGVTPGSADLALRPVDEAADRMCDSCGINNLPPGALAAT
jgi:DMSO reductase family type II enzyme chaperone